MIVDQQARKVRKEYKGNPVLKVNRGRKDYPANKAYRVKQDHKD